MSSVTSIYSPYRLTFLLPDGLLAFVRPGVHQPCIAGCILLIDRSGLTSIEGKTRGLVFEQASRFFRLTAKDRPAFMISAVLITPDRRKEAWEIAINSQVTFTRDVAPVICSELQSISNSRGE